jgi:hypothetical protein
MSIALNTNPPGAIDNYADLVTEIAEWLNRTDLNARIPGFIRLCESRLNRLLRTPDMETTAPIVATAEDNALPLDFLAMRSLYIEGSPDRPLNEYSPNSMARAYSGSAGIPVGFAVFSGILRLVPPPAASTTLQMVYFAKLTPLTDGLPSNWLLESHADIYLYGTLLCASAFVDDPARVQQWKAAYDEAIGELISAGAKARYGSGPLVPTAVRQVSGVTC